jgi:predicted unusual protein kinase regulating ubiquinone biosynthesis (AarF/ABC1/UbiB family)
VFIILNINKIKMLGKLYHLYSTYSIYKRLENLKNKKDDILKKELDELKKTIMFSGCLNIKLTQWYISKLKSNKDKNSNILTSYFEDIFEQCPRHELKYTLDLFKNDYNFDLSVLVDMDSMECIASGSVGQVYKCKLLDPVYIIDTSHKLILDILSSNNIPVDYILNIYWVNYEEIDEIFIPIIKKIEYVALKVKHPDINNDIEYKISCVDILTSVQNNLYLKNLFGLHIDFKDFIDNITQQINFNNEHYNNNIFRRNYLGNYLNYFPRTLWSSYNIIITEFISSKSLSEFTQFNQLKICLNLGCSISKMILIDNFCHGDIHEKNWGIDLYSDNTITNEPRIIYYDYGICFKSHSNDLNRKLWEQFEEGNVENIVNISKQLIIGEFDENDIKNELADIISHFKGYTLDIVNLMYNINKVLERHNCKLSSILLNLVLVLSLIDSTLKTHNLIGSNNNNARSNHYVELREKSLDMMAYCNSKKIFPKLSNYMYNKRQNLSSKINQSDNKINAFGKSNTLILELPE